jgi:hypothetical protein
MRRVGRTRVVSVPGGGTVAGDGGLDLKAGRIGAARMAAAIACIAALALAALALTAPSIHSPALSQRVQSHPAASLPASLIPTASVTIGGSQRAFWPARHGATLSSEGGRITSSFSAAGVRLRTVGGTLALSAPSLGRGRHLQQVSAVAPSGAANEVVYRHGSLTELYRNGPYGLEQAFTVGRRPGAGVGSLVLALGLAGSLSARQAGSQIVFRGASGAPALRYGQLSTLDATGRQLPSHMQIRNGTLQLLIDDSGARYPLRIDPFFQQGVKLTGGEESGKGEFGGSAALSADGNTALIGGPTDNANVGAAWVFTRSGSTWEQQGPKLTGGEESGKGRFGFRVALSADGSTALIGGPVDNAEAGAAWVFTPSGSTWEQQGPKLTGGEESGKGEFGAGVALSGDGSTAVIGGGGDNSGAGAAWAFTRTESTWAQQGPKLTGAGEVGAAHLGFRVALSEDGNTALIGGGGDNGNAGAAWVFTRSEATWEQQGSKLTGGEESGAGHFGYSVALSADGSIALVGGLADSNEIGAAWAFTRTESTWEQQGPKLTGAGEVGKGLFGYSVALSGDGKSALIGGGGDNTSVGAAWPFTRTGSTWEPEGAKLTGSGEVGKGLFGYSVALSSDATTALIGGAGDNSAVGAAWVFANVLQAPTVVTGAASAVTQSSATLNATVNPNGATVSDCHFNYGTSTSYGSSVPCTTLPGSGTSPVAVSAPLTGLIAKTTYHFQIVATNATGTGEGTDQTFTTANPPEFGRCVKLAKGVKGRYSTAACTVPATSLKFAYEWELGPGPKAKFTTKLKESTLATFETIKKKLVVCKGETSTGEYTGLNTVGNVVFTFTGCEMAGAKCTSAGAEEGEVLTNTLEGALGIEKTSPEGPVKNKIALDLFPVGGTGPLVEFSCGATPVVITGSVLNTVLANKMALSGTVKYAAVSGKQKPEKFEGLPKDVLETAFGEAPFEQSALKLVTVQTNEEKIEINSVV